MRGYQFLKNDFFALCNKRQLSISATLLLIYLNGLYSFFRKPVFYCSDSQVTDHLPFSVDTLRRARKELQVKGLIEFKSSHGRGRSIAYAILETDVAPEIKGSNLPQKGSILRGLIQEIASGKGSNLRPPD